MHVAYVLSLSQHVHTFCETDDTYIRCRAILGPLRPKEKTIGFFFFFFLTKKKMGTFFLTIICIIMHVLFMH
jgi:hypothetical protein